MGKNNVTELSPEMSMLYFYLVLGEAAAFLQVLHQVGLKLILSYEYKCTLRKTTCHFLLYWMSKSLMKFRFLGLRLSDTTKS